MSHKLIVEVLLASAIFLEAKCFAKNKRKVEVITPEERTKMERLSELPGHMKPLGSAGPFFNLYTVDGFPKTRDFFNKYVIPSTPLLMKNAAKISPAFTKWTDEYFINHPDSRRITIFAEGGKREIRKPSKGFMTFRTFVEKYNTTGMYMISGLPKHIRSDVIIPPPVQCDPVIKNVFDVVTWFSSGGTKSTLHSDGADNINCLYRGEKTLVFVNPHDDPEMWKLVIEKPNGSYSSLDVDAVDFTKFPDLARVRYAKEGCNASNERRRRYAKVHMTAGDCLYIPYRWYHQVNSFGSNLAVNIWWIHETSKFFDLDDEKCGDFTGRNTIADIAWTGMEGESSEYSSGGAYGEPENLDNAKTEKFLKQFSDENFESEATPKEYADEAPHLHGNDPKQLSEREEDGKEEEDEQYTGAKKDTITDKIYRSAIRLSRHIPISGIKRYVLREMAPPTDVWDERCQDILINYFGMLDQDKDTVITSEDADLFYAADEHKMDENYDITALFEEDLWRALTAASLVKDRELVLKLMERGDIDKEQITTIFGNQMDVPVPDSMKDEL